MSTFPRILLCCQDWRTLLLGLCYPNLPAKNHQALVRSQISQPLSWKFWFTRLGLENTAFRLCLYLIASACENQCIPLGREGDITDLRKAFSHYLQPVPIDLFTTKSHIASCWVFLLKTISGGGIVRLILFWWSVGAFSASGFKLWSSRLANWYVSLLKASGFLCYYFFRLDSNH